MMPRSGPLQQNTPKRAEAESEYCGTLCDDLVIEASFPDSPCFKLLNCMKRRPKDGMIESQRTVKEFDERMGGIRPSRVLKK